MDFFRFFIFSLSYALIWSEKFNSFITFGIQSHHNGLKINPQTGEYYLKGVPFPPNNLDQNHTMIEVVSQLPPKKKTYSSRNTKNLKNYTLPLSSNYEEYWIEIGIGTPPQFFKVQIDTGSSVLAVPGPDCSICQSEGQNSFDITKSSTASFVNCHDKSTCSAQVCFSNTNLDNENQVCAFNLSYGGGSSVWGGIATDQIGWLTLEKELIFSTQADFGIISVESSPFQTPAVDGILGLAYNSRDMTCVPSCITPLFNVLVQKSIVRDYFSLELNSPDIGGGTITLGGSNPSYKYKNQTTTWIKVASEAFYTVVMNEIKLGNKNLRSEKVRYGATIIDSGTTWLMFPSEIYQGFKNELINNYSQLPGISGPNTIFGTGYSRACINSKVFEENPDLFNQYPNFTITLDEYSFIVPPKQWLQRTYFANGSAYCLVVGEMGNGNELTILGDTFMKGFYIQFDRENQRIGFIPEHNSLIQQWDGKLPTSSLPLWIFLIPSFFFCFCLSCIVIFIVFYRKFIQDYEREFVAMTNFDE